MAAEDQAAIPAEDRAPDIVVTTLEGNSFSLADQRGKAVVVLFSASWCGSCVPEVQKLTQLRREYAERGLEVLFLSLDPLDTPEDWSRFRQLAKGPERYWALDPGNRATLAYKVQSADTKVLIDSAGRVVARHVGPTPYGVLQSEIEQAL